MMRLSLSLLTIVAITSPAAAIQLTFTNSSTYPSSEVYVWFGGAAEAGYDLKIAGTNQNITLGHSYPLSALAPGLAASRLISGRVYFSLGQPLPDPGRNAAGSPLRYPGVQSGDDGHNIRWDFIEFTESNSPGDVADLTSMDNFGVPLSLQLRRQGTSLSGPNTAAGWKGHTDAQIVAALGALADPAGTNVFDPGGNFRRIRGANSFPVLYQNEPGNPRSTTAYLAAIQAAGRTTTLDGTAFATTYQYSAALDAAGNYVLTKTGGAAANPQTILIPASYKAGPNPADPTVTLAESIYMSNPWYGVDGGPVGPTQNNLAGAVARDLYAALNLGYVNSSHVVTAAETVNPALVGKHVYELTSSQMRELTIGFGEVNKFYNLYAAAIRDLSDSYGFAYSDWNEHLSKVAVLLHQSHGGLSADELHVDVAGTRLLRGDYNHDLQIDAADYTLWRDALGNIEAGHPADGNYDGTIDTADYEIWKAAFGASSGAASMASSAVPEPPSALFVTLAITLRLAAARRRYP